MVSVSTNCVFVTLNSKEMLVKIKSWTLKKSNAKLCVWLAVSKNVLKVILAVLCLVWMIVLKDVLLEKPKVIRKGRKRH